MRGGSIFLKSFVFFIIFMIFWGSYGFSENNEKGNIKLREVVVTATRTETSIKHISDSITIISGDEIEKKLQLDLYSVLKDVPGVSMKRCGGPGQWSYVRMRGGFNRHIKVLINGMDFSDPLWGDFSDYWSYLDTEDIEKIEIVSGPQSSLYGSGAISGVINIITKKGRGKPKIYVKAEGGSMDLLKGAVRINGAYKDFGYNLNYSYVEGGGVFKHEEHRDSTVSGRFDYSFLENINLDYTIRYTDSWRNYNQWDYKTFKAYDDPRAFRNTYLFFSNLGITHKVFNWWDYKIAYAYTEDTTHRNDPNDGILYANGSIIVRDSFSKGKTKGKKNHVFLQNNFSIFDIDKLSMGYEYERDRGDYYYESAWGKKKYSMRIHNNSWYAHNQIFLIKNIFSIGSGVRTDDHSKFGTHTTYKLGVACLIDKFSLKLKANYGTGFKAPNMFQLYDPKYGNPHLDPEESESWDVGFLWHFFDKKVIVEGTYFHNHFKDLISFDYTTWKYTNINTAKSYGVEATLKVYPTDDLGFRLNYTYTDGKEEVKGEEKGLSIVPKHEVNCNLFYSLRDFFINLDLYYIGKRLAYDHKHVMGGYMRLDVSASYIFLKHFNIFAKVENLFDRKYEAAYGYPAPKLSAWAGLKASF